MTVAILILLAAATLLILDVWAFFGWRDAILADDRETRTRRRAGFRAAVLAARAGEPGSAGGRSAPAAAPADEPSQLPIVA
jgi:hypothetical protein